MSSAAFSLSGVLMSGYTPVETQNGEASAVPRLRKPFTMSDLTRALELVFDRAVLDHDAVQQPVT